MTPTCVLRVALPVPRGTSYDYRCDDVTVQPGQRVRVPFGPRRLVGVVVGRADEAAVNFERLRDVLDIIDDTPLVDADWLALLDFTARYYVHPLGQAIATALPATLRQGKAARPVGAKRWRLTPAGQTLELTGLSRRAPRQAAVIRQLRAASEAQSAPEISPDRPVSAVLRALADKELIATAEPEDAATCRAEPVALDAAQQAIMQAIGDAAGFQAHLLEGVTGSGKTEVYLDCAQQAIASGRQVLMLVPEIGLTPQMIDRVRRRSGARVAVLHSGLADGSRHDAWLAARDGRADIVLGTRSAVFVPLARPGLIIIDEEHDSSYKQQDGLRYHARDLALRRAQMANIPALLGSATPALETLHQARAGRYQHHRLAQRFGKAGMPRLGRIDLRHQRSEDGLSPPLIARIDKHLARGNQVLLFINRRGFAPVTLCHDCGWQARCNRCDARMITHRRSHSLRCHHCGAQRRLPGQCPDCQSEDLRFIGQGTERLETKVAERWPAVGRLRFDRDVLARRGELEAALERIHSGAAQLLIGTQMLAKGHDFPRLSLVAVIDADQGIYGQDFRAAEHMAQQVIQVAGRAGRRGEQGEVWLQTHNPDHPLLQQLERGEYAPLAEQLLAERQALGWPPFSRLGLIRAESADPDKAAGVLDQLCEQMPRLPEVELLGPVPAVMERRAGLYRHQLLLRCARWQVLNQALGHLRQLLEQMPGARQVRWSIDVDPQFLD